MVDTANPKKISEAECFSMVFYSGFGSASSHKGLVMTLNYKNSLWVGRITLLTSLSTLLLLCAGALVTGTGSGLAVPDWPLSFGQFFPPMVGGVLYEHGHRLIAGYVALLTMLQCVFIFKWESRAWVKKLSVLAVALVLTQALLGGLTVLFQLPKAISIAHACLGQTYFCNSVVLAMVTSQLWGKKLQASPDHSAFPIRWLALLVVVGFFIQLLLGATMRHFGSGLAIPDFPLSFGRWIPASWTFPVAIHFAHRAGAFVMVTLVAALVARVYRLYWNQFVLLLYAGALMGFVWMQIMLGAMIIWLRRPLALTTIHLAVGALCLASSVTLAIQLFRAQREAVPENDPRLKELDLRTAKV
ncbi:MAG: heme A synthase [Proteobacteria bacterium]|nr:heme A synthase [Pseudomonadota bacterium]